MPPQAERCFGIELLKSLDFDPERTVFATMELPWKLAEPRLRSPARHVEFVKSMERARLDEAASALPPVDSVIGVGGGSALDFAKY
ncbi:unnamed protein product, partial [marine sediment metagenome]